MHTRQGVGATDAPTQNIFSLDMDVSQMYPREYTAEGRLKHSEPCRAAFNRYDWHCPRCAELMHGACARGSWHGAYFKRKLSQLHLRLF